MSWDLSSEDVICDKLESQQRTIEMFSRKIKELEAKLLVTEKGRDHNLVRLIEYSDQCIDLEAKLQVTVGAGLATKKYYQDKEDQLKNANHRTWLVKEKLKVAVEALERARNGGWGLLDHWDNAKSALLKIRE